MSLQAKIFLNLLAGAAGGGIAWILTDLTGWFSDVLDAQQTVGFDPKYLLYGALFGAILGLMLGVIEGLSMDSSRQLMITLCVAPVVGFVGGGLGLLIGQRAFELIVNFDLADANGSPELYARLLIARAIGWALIGSIIGLMQGLVRRSASIARQGAFGGFIGGTLGGFIFQTVATLLNSAQLSRLCALVAIGALVGFFVGLVPNLFKQAWIRVVLGRNEGKEYLVAKPVTTIGRSELSDIGLFGDPQIAPTHAVIEALTAQKRHRLRHVATGRGGKPGSFAPTVVNGQTINSEQWLVDGDTIQIANRTLLFREKATRRTSAPVEAASAPRPDAVPDIPDGHGVTAGAPVAARRAEPRESMTPSWEILDLMGVPPDASPPVSPYPDLPLPPLRAVPRQDPLPSDLPRTELRRDKLRQPAPRAGTRPTDTPGAGITQDIPPRDGADETSGETEPLDAKTMVMEPARGGVGRRLICTAGPYSGQSFPLGHMAMSIGRSSGCDVPLPADTSISRRHARVTYTGGRHILFDYGSSNGVHVNGQRVIGSQLLSAGDVIKFGDTRMRYE